MYGICDHCEYFMDLGEIGVSCDMGHEIIENREQCDGYSETDEEAGGGTWSEE